MNKNYWMARGPGGLSDGGEMAYDNSSRVEPKRSQQWFIDGTEAELLPNKKQAVEVPNHTSFSGLLNSNISPWGNASSFQSVAGQFTERLFDLETVRTINFDDRVNPSVGVGSMNLGRKVIDDPFGSDSSFGLSISHSLEDPRSGLNYGGIRKVKVSQVKDSENFISGSVGHGYGRGDNTMSASHAYRTAGDASVTMGLSFNRGDENVISGSETFNRADGNFISMGQSYDKGDNSHISMGQTYKEDNTDISMGYSFVKDENNVMTMRETFNKDKDTVSMSHTFKDNNDDVSVGQPFSKVDSSIISRGQTVNKGSDNTISIGHTYNNVDDDTMSIGRAYNKMDDNDLLMRHCLSKGESTIISFDGLNNDDDSNPTGRLICSYDLLMGQSSVRSSEELNEKGLIDSNADVLANAAQRTNPGDSFSKKKVEQKVNKKAPPNNFPSNVRSLLSTGMLDGVPVKYVAWSREKELRGIIRGSGYLCSCQSCNLSKAINAYEFERHAGCKTKHPNNHIYFENGKTIYGIVQELRNTPQNLLFEVIQTITGSPINQKSFRLWKESFLAATRELQRIYGKEEGKQLS